MLSAYDDIMKGKTNRQTTEEKKYAHTHAYLRRSHKIYVHERFHFDIYFN